MQKKEPLFSEQTLNFIKGFTLENIEKFGKANSNAILGKMLGENPDLKTKINELKKEIESTIKIFSKLSKKEFTELHKKYTAHLINLPKKEKKEGLPELKHAKDYVFRFAPSPSGPIHIGRMIPLLLNSEYAKKYKGKFILRIEDTDPSKVALDIYKQIEEDTKWLTGNKIDEIVIQSDRIEDYYKHAEELIDSGHAYVCTCKPEEWRKFVDNKLECPHRILEIMEQKKRWHNMLKSWPEGSSVLRIKTNMSHPNPAIRDWPAFRITEDSHPRHGKKYRVWPLMNFSVAIDDHEYGLTHVIRGKDHITNAERQKYLFEYFNWPVPEYIHTGRINFEGVDISASEFYKDIQNKKYSGVDDPKLPTAAAFKRRGLLPEAFIRYIHELGPSKVDKTVSYEEFMQSIYAFNRSLIEKDANRYFIIEDPIVIEIKNMPDIKAELPLHPDFPKRGIRKFHKSNKFYIESKDKPLKDKNYRLMHLCNFSGKDLKFISQHPDSKLDAKAVHWLPVTDKEKSVKIRVMMSHGKDIKAIGEQGLANLKPGAIIQFERKFFAKFDGQEGDVYVFYQMHK